MENATHALLIAAGILFGILTLSVFVYMFNNISEMQQAQYIRAEEERLAEWNAEWEAYNKKLLYGAEVLTVLNKAEQNNAEYNNDVKHTVEVKVIDGGAIRTQIKSNGTITNKIYVEQHKTSIFKCIKMERNSETGKIKLIEFEFVK